MRDRALSAAQREILGWLTDGWTLCRWPCLDGSWRWHMGADEVDGRTVAGLVRRGLLERGGDYPTGQLVLTNAGRDAIRTPEAR
jgi:hypothetical protein